MISCAVRTMRTACLKSSIANSPSSLTNFIRFRLARLQAESSRYMYSLHGVDALMGAVLADVCQRLMLSWYWIPGSPQTQAASAILLRRYRALTVSTGSPEVMAWVVQSLSSSTARMKSSVTRTELFEFWKKTDAYASPPLKLPSYPASMSAQAFCSSLSLQSMNSSTSGWSALRITIFAARRVLPPDLITPANASKPFMKLTGPDASPPPASFSLEERMVERFEPVPEPCLKSMPSVLAKPRMDSMVSSTELMKHAALCGRSSMPTLNHTGELNAARCLRRMSLSSLRKASASSSVAK